LPLLAYYRAEINEQWRDSAALVLQITGSKSGAIHVYGDALNYRFFTQSVAPDLRLIEIPEGAAADLGNEPITSCPILLWVVGVLSARRNRRDRGDEGPGNDGFGGAP
jgi:hypothetical protein